MNEDIHRVPSGRGLAWVTQALDVAGRRPGLVLSAMLLGVLSMLAAMLVLMMLGLTLAALVQGGAADAANKPGLAMLGIGMAPVLLVGIFAQPLLFAGWLHVLREVESGRPVGLSGVFIGLTGGRALPLASLGLVQVASSALNLLASHVFGGEGYLAAYLSYLSSLTPGTLASPPIPEQAMLLFLASLLIGFFGFTAQMYAVPQVLFQGRRPLPAVLQSLRASVVNVLPLTVAGLVMIVGLVAGTLMLTLVGALLMFLAGAIAKVLAGLVATLIALFAMALVLALMFGGIYLSWRDMFGDDTPRVVEPPLMHAEL